jgi:malate synthase
MMLGMEATIAPPKNSDANAIDVQSKILTPDAQAFLSKLAGRFEARRQELLARRRIVQQEINKGKFPDFLPETAEIRRKDWKVA